jgi:hypothetical protein
VFVALLIQHTVRMRHSFPNYLINDTIFEKVFEHKMCVLIFSTNLFRIISHF